MGLGRNTTDIEQKTQLLETDAYTTWRVVSETLGRLGP